MHPSVFSLFSFVVVFFFFKEHEGLGIFISTKGRKTNRIRAVTNISEKGVTEKKISRGKRRSHDHEL